MYPRLSLSSPEESWHFIKSLYKRGISMLLLEKCCSQDSPEKTLLGNLDDLLDNLFSTELVLVFEASATMERMLNDAFHIVVYDPS